MADPVFTGTGAAFPQALFHPNRAGLRLRPCRHEFPRGRYRFFERPVRLRQAISVWLCRDQRSRHRSSSARKSRSKARELRSGASAEMLAPKWFDKRPHLSLEQTRRRSAARALMIARELYLGDRRLSRPRSACTPRASRRRSRPARAKISRRSPRPTGRLKSTRRFLMRCFVVPG